jgi:hypothetical protein
MPASTTHPTDLYAALALLRNTLPGLMGKPGWDDLDTGFRDACMRLGTGDPAEQARAADDLRQGLAGHPAAEREVSRLVAEVGRVRDRVRVALQGEFHGRDLGSDAPDLYATCILRRLTEKPEPPRRATRAVHIKEGGKGGAVTVKFANLWVNLDEVGVDLGHHGAVHAVIAAGATMSPYAEAVLLGVTLLAVGRCLWRGAHLAIPEEEATVYWGLVQAQKARGVLTPTPLADAVNCTNRERQKFGMGGLAEQDVRRALLDLQRKGCVAEAVGQPDHWRVTENPKIKG